ncbi:phosphoglycerate mutase family protein [Vibrio sp. LaRot3]|uniref:phosphoglycerate mutase family protein n=1 Tax=Vibrio sp. LaRot3 TaxID=2998829 RepID=UPI0022CE05AE|nr:phosphoglycerate mutase family protein [Vibrio sp. LaRot3]MDA0149648.1 phosphoglycerate mutase family protein [Vibrio sp. LaRot3]
MNITLVRHGKPTASCNPTVKASGFANWVRAYNHSYIAEDSQPTKPLQDKLTGHFIFASNLNRARHSAQLCIGKQPDMVLPELRELDIPRLKIPLKMKVNHWLAISRILWLFGISGNSESITRGRARIRKAVDSLEQQVTQTPNIAVFGHGLANRFIAKELVKRGWQVKQKGSGFWSSIELTKPVPS